MLFGGHSVGITNAKKALEWQKVADAVNAVASQPRTVAEIKKKWSDIKVEAKKRLVINSIREVAKELGEIKTVLTEINCTMREFLNK